MVLMLMGVAQAARDKAVVSPSIVGLMAKMISGVRPFGRSPTTSESSATGRPDAFNGEITAPVRGKRFVLTGIDGDDVAHVRHHADQAVVAQFISADAAPASGNTVTGAAIRYSKRILAVAGPKWPWCPSRP
jgi:hypothetical protein